MGICFLEGVTESLPMSGNCQDTMRCRCVKYNSPMLLALRCIAPRAYIQVPSEDRALVVSDANHQPGRRAGLKGMGFQSGCVNALLCRARLQPCRCALEIKAALQFAEKVHFRDVLVAQELFSDHIFATTIHDPAA